MSIYEKLRKVQNEVKVPKNQYNDYGGYKYRSCEDIVEAVKPLLLKHELTMIITDEIIMKGDRFYIKADAKITDGEDSIITTGWAREPLNQKGKDESQITGSASTYARKYALNGMFAIDDTKDADSLNKHGKGQNNGSPKQTNKTDSQDAEGLREEIRRLANTDEKVEIVMDILAEKGLSKLDKADISLLKKIKSELS